MKKFLNAFLVFAICMCTAFSFIACGDNTADNRDSRMVAIYGTYVAYAEENDITPLSYEEWLESVKGQNGKDGVDGKDGLSVKSVIVNEDGKLIITFTDNSTIDAGLVKGANGKDGVGIADMKIENGKLYVKYTDSDEYIELGQVKGADGKDGITPTIEVSADGYWVIGGIKTEVKALASDGRDGVDGKDGVDGANGKDGRGIAGVSYKNGILIITYTDGSKEEISLQDETEGTEGLEYYPLPNNTFGVKAGTTTYLDKIIIPKTYKNKAITQILDSAFCNAKNLKEIQLPDTIEKIESHAFAGCSSLKSINIPSSVNFIGDYSFYECENLTLIGLPANITTIKQYSFYGCNFVDNKITIPKTVEKIEPYAFKHIEKVYFESNETWQITCGTAYIDSSYPQNAEKNYYDSLGGAKVFTLSTKTDIDYSNYFNGIKLTFSLPNNAIERYLKSQECTWIKQ